MIRARPGPPTKATVSVPRTAPAPPPPGEDGAGPRDPRQLLPAVALALPMVAAYAALGWSPRGMLDWAVSRPGLAAGEYAPILLHMFAHGGLIHIAFNLLALFALTPAVMERLGLPSLRAATAYFALFLLCGLGGLALWLAFPHGAPMLGASGAIFGLLGFILRQPDPDAPPAALVSRATADAFWTFAKLHLPLIVIFAIPLLLGAGGFGLAWESHLGGFVAGLLLWRPIRRLAGMRAL